MRSSLKIPFLLFIFIIYCPFLYSQKEMNDSIQDPQAKVLLYQSRKNMFKFNATSLVFRNLQFQAERALNKTISLGFSFATISKGDIFFKDILLDAIGDDPDIANMINSATVGYTSFTPEVRFYLGKGFGKGFYLAPFYRSSKYTIADAEVFEYELDDGNFETLVVNGDLNSNTFGLLIGVQFNLGSRVILDWWIMGPHYGNSSGTLTGISSRTLSQTEQDRLLAELNDIDVPLSDTTYEVSANGARMINDGPWGGIRSGLSLGVRF
jgi:hypothetical protein